MATPATTVELLDQVRNLGLCDPVRLSGAFPPDMPLPDSPNDAVNRLVRGGACTRFQGRMLLAGKGRRLLLGKYRLLRPLGKGGGGSVFLGEHTDLRRQVAVKVQRIVSADPLAAERFRREARYAAALDHPNVVKLFDYGATSGTQYLVMEFVSGVTVQQLLDSGGPLSVGAAVHIITQAALGLAHAHARGIVHRDVKPLNVMVMPDGGVKVLDMGLARAFDCGEDQLTEQAGHATICGTIDYLSPEQCVGVAVDGRSDIYSLGVMLFAMLAGRLPFLGTSAEKVAQHQTAEPPRLDVLVPAVPASLACVVARMLAKRPANRPQTCQELIHSLTPWCPPDPVPLCDLDPQRTVNRINPRRVPVSWSAGGSRFTGRPKWAGWVVALLATCVVAAVAVALSVRPAPHVSLVVPSDPQDAVELLLEGHADTVNQLVFSSDGKHLIGVDWSGAVCVWDTANGALSSRQVVKAGGVGNSVTLTPDGRALVCGEKVPTALWDLSGGKLLFKLEEPADRTWAVEPSPDGKRVLIASDKSVRTRNLTTGELVHAFDPGMGWVWSAAYSPDGMRIAACGREPGDTTKPGVPGAIAIWDAESGKQVWRFSEHLYDVRWVAFSTDGTRLVSGGFDYQVRIWNLKTGECERVYTDKNMFVERAQYLPNGLVLTLAACDHNLPETHTSTVDVWDPSDPRHTPLWSRTFPGRATTVAYSPTAKLYAVANKDKQVWLMRAPEVLCGR